MATIKKGDKYKSKDGEIVTVMFVTNEVVTVQKDGSLLPMRRFVFLQDYEVVECETVSD